MLMALAAETKSDADEFAERVNAETSKHGVKAERIGELGVHLWGSKDAIESILQKCQN